MLICRYKDVLQGSQSHASAALHSLQQTLILLRDALLHPISPGSGHFQWAASNPQEVIRMG